MEMLNAWKEEIKVEIRSEDTNNTLKNQDQKIESTENKVDTMKKQFKKVILFELLEKEIDMDKIENNLIELINIKLFKDFDISHVDVKSKGLEDLSRAKLGEF